MTPIYEYLTEEIIPEEKRKARTIRRKAGRYAVTNIILYKRSFLGQWLRCVEPLQANYVLREIHEGSCSMHAGPRSVVAKALRSGYYWPTMHADARKLIRNQGTVGRNTQKLDGRDFTCLMGTPYYDQIKQRRNTILTYVWNGSGDPVEISMPTLRTAKVDMIKNDEALEINLDLLEERREQAAIQEAKSKAKMEKYYNARVRNTSFNPGDLVYRNNEASHAKDGGKLGPKWEGPYEVTEALGKGAYKLIDRNGNILSRTWNVCNLKKFYVHEM
ncbi:reverse transcriptase domain-containing protein [Tanacetum coccineum]|uniref:Reverse transcriptase domain-containing protein n=1 Tax=Tanacetum coccineum TaxID=301880 RepID=A0ABQ5FEL5_9ASTR